MYHSDILQMNLYDKFTFNRNQTGLFPNNVFSSIIKILVAFKRKLFGFDGYWYNRMQHKKLNNNNQDQMEYLCQELVEYIEKSIFRPGLFKNRQQIVEQLFNDNESNYQECLKLLTNYCTQDISLPTIYRRACSGIKQFIICRMTYLMVKIIISQNNNFFQLKSKSEEDTNYNINAMCETLSGMDIESGGKDIARGLFSLTQVFWDFSTYAVCLVPSKVANIKSKQMQFINNW